jgi:hypothetical protein
MFAKLKQSHFVSLSFASSRQLRVCFRFFFASFRIFLFEAKKGHPMPVGFWCARFPTVIATMLGQNKD